ncbi:hypothetical protein QN391_25265 [Pseudomonas sp. CCI1.2]|uniref:hypothetical protein n=1 Tax=Pseudomonas sp. CCI1.2 TaxID=3048614 RepID=UPI002B2367EC|nr:hypothetical protein [Pseudomonas sp. CCI1.2]MEB0123965.1 hypothetical protein [Pseudomonas sp. CCI1.2]
MVQSNASRLREAGHTPKIPLEIGINTLKNSIKWVMVYGEPIIDAIVYFVERSAMIVAEDTPVSHKHKDKDKVFIKAINEFKTTPYPSLPPEALGKILNIAKFNPKTHLYCNEKDGVSFFHVMQCLIGACAITIAIMKPIRDTELAGLLRSCLDPEPTDGGAFLTHENNKSGSMGLNDKIRRPIPFVSAHAIQLLQRLGTRLVKFYGDTSPHASELFYFPSTRALGKPSGNRMRHRIDKCIKAFCDQINMPIDKYGRRWYVRIHELRKFFILSMHQHEQYYTDEALRYQAGHTNRDHLDDYLSGDIPRDEICHYEAECIDEKLISLELGKILREDNAGLTALYDHIRKHFGVVSIKSRNTKQYFDLLEKMIYRKEILLSVYTIQLEDYNGNVSDNEIAIKFGQTKDEKF